jgi:urease accessory protein
MDASVAQSRADALLLALQHGDSFFPGGGIAFSWGLEALREDGCVARAEEVAAFVRGQLEHRWAVCDRAVLAAAHGAAGEFDALRALDHALEAMTLAPELRDGSRRAGASLLSVHERLGTPGAAAYRAQIRGEAALGHLPVVQGMVWRGVGLGLPAVESVAAHQVCIGLIGAALRLGLIGHLQGQQILSSMRPVVASILSAPAVVIEDIFTCTPATDIASMRHEMQSSRLFVN